MIQISMMTTEQPEHDAAGTRWFSADGCVVTRGEDHDVFVGGTLVGSDGHGDEATRNLLLVNLALEPRVNKGRLAWAFGLGVDQARKIRRRVEAGGVEALFHRPTRGRPAKVTPAIRTTIYAMFEQGQQVRDVWAVVSSSPKRFGGIGRWTVRDLRSAWLGGQRQRPTASDTAPQPEQLALPRMAQAVSAASTPPTGPDAVTYERRPYPMLPRSWFTEKLVVGGADGTDVKVIGVHEHRRKNLGKGRGRVRRIALRMPDGHQVNLLAISTEPVARLVAVMLGRWVQENGFKHGNERWGINQLDGRKTVPYPPETLVPNPARRRLDHAMKLARAQEGRARSKLARLADDDPRRDRYQKDLDEALLDQDLYQTFRLFAPTKAPLQDTELSGKLVKHDPDYKALLDTLRIACANAEAELALMLAPTWTGPKRPKRPWPTSSPLQEPSASTPPPSPSPYSPPPHPTSQGHILVLTMGSTSAFAQLCHQINLLGLTQPDDPDDRKLRVRVRF